MQRRRELASVSLLIGLTLAETPAKAISITFDDANPTFITSTSGTLRYFLDGTIDIDPGFEVNRLSFSGALDDATHSHNIVSGSDDPALASWFIAASTEPGLSYTGHLIDVVVDPTDPAGLYDFTPAAALPFILVTEHLDSNVTQTTNFTITLVNPATVPEPGTLLVLSSSLIGFCAAHWSRRRASPEM